MQTVLSLGVGREVSLLMCGLISVAAQGGDSFTDPVEALGVDYADLESRGLDRYSVPVIVVFYIIIMGALVIFCQLVYWPRFCKTAIAYVQSRLSRFLLKQKFFGTPLIILHEISMAFMAFVSCVIFLFLSIMVTNGQGEIFEEPVIIWVEFLLGWFFLGDYIVHFILAPDKLMYVFDASALVNLLSFVPAVIAPIIFRFFYGFDFLRAVHIYRAFSVIQATGWLPIPPRVPFLGDKPARARQFIQHWMVCTFLGADMPNDTVQFVTKTLLLLSTYIFCMACFVFVTENMHQNPEGQIDDMLDSTYFVIVTVSTVGYGDFSPRSRVGKAVVMIFILLCLVTLVPMMLVFAERVKEAWNTRWYLGTQHVLVCGDSENVLHFCQEFYAERRSPYEDTKMVVMHSQELPEDVRRKLKAAHFSKYLRVMQGDATSEYDLERAGLQRAKSLVILADSANSNRYQEDLRIVTRVDSAKRFVPGVPVYAQVLGKTDTIRAMGVELVFEAQRLFYSLIAQSCFTPGLSTLVTNLVLHSDMPMDSRKWDGVRRKPSSKDLWEEEYLRGCKMGLWPMPLPDETVGKSFPQLVHEAYLQTGGKCLIVGVRGGLQPGRHKIDLLNPGRHYIVKRHDVAYVIASHRRHPRRMAEMLAHGHSDPLSNYLYRASPSALQSHLPDVSTIGQELQRIGEGGVNATKGLTDPFLGVRAEVAGVEVDLDKAKAIIGRVRNIDGPTEVEDKVSKARSLESLVKDPSIPRDARLLTELSNHILIIGWHDNAVYLLQSLRNERLATNLRQRKIVLLIPDTVEVPSKTWAKVAHLKKISVIRYEHPLNKNDLNSAGVQFASKLILMNDVHVAMMCEQASAADLVPPGITFDNPEEVVAMTDANVVALWRRVYRELMLHDLDTIALLEKNENAKYFDEKTHQPIMEVDSLRSPAYAAGRIVFSGSLAKFVAACYFNNGLQSISEQLTEVSVVRVSWKTILPIHSPRASVASVEDATEATEDLGYVVDGLSVTYGMVVEKLILGESVCILPLGLYRTRKVMDRKSGVWSRAKAMGLKGLKRGASTAARGAAMVGGEGMVEDTFQGMYDMMTGEPALTDENSYVMTNPSPDTLLLDHDDLFVLFPNESNWKSLQREYWRKKTELREKLAEAEALQKAADEKGLLAKAGGSEDSEAVEMEEIPHKRLDDEVESLAQEGASGAKGVEMEEMPESKSSEVPIEIDHEEEGTTSAKGSGERRKGKGKRGGKGKGRGKKEDEADKGRGKNMKSLNVDISEEESSSS